MVGRANNLYAVQKDFPMKSDGPKQPTLADKRADATELCLSRLRAD